MTVKNYFLVRMDILVFQFEVESQGLFLKQSQISFVNNHSVRLLYYWFSFKKVCNFKTCMGSYRQKIICTQSLLKLMLTEYSKMLSWQWGCLLRHVSSTTSVLWHFNHFSLFFQNVKHDRSIKSKNLFSPSFGEQRVKILWLLLDFAMSDHWEKRNISQLWQMK